MLEFYTEYSGDEFNRIYENTKFFKFINNNFKHHELEYKLGLNVDIHPFNSSKGYSGGGICFWEESKCNLFWQDYGTLLATIKIPNDARVCVKENKFKTDKIIIENIVSFFDVDDNFWLSISDEQKPCYYRYTERINALHYVKEKTHKTYKLLLWNYNFMYDERTSKLSIEEYYHSIVQQSGFGLQYIKNQTYEICKLAVQKNGQHLKYVEDQFKTEELCKLAVQNFGYALEYVNEQTYEICKLAVLCKPPNRIRCGNVLKYVKDQFKTKELCILAVEGNGYAIRYVNDPTEEICVIAVQENGNALEFVNDKTENICKQAVKKTGDALEFVDKQTEEICIMAVQQNGHALKYVKEQTPLICESAVQENGNMLEYVKNQTPLICKLAVQQNAFAIRFVRNQSELTMFDLCKIVIEELSSDWL